LSEIEQRNHMETLTEVRSDNRKAQTKAKPKPGGLEVLDAIRGGAALYVVCHHARILLMMSNQDAHSAAVSTLQRLLVQSSVIFSFGHQAVLLFFVLSGFCIHLRQAEQLSENPSAAFNLRQYAGRRFRRIAPPYYWAILFTFLIDMLATYVNPHFVKYGGNNTYVNYMIFQYKDVKTLLGNLVFLQSVAFPPYGNNTPLWSLSYEFYFYVLYPLYLALRTRLGITKSMVATAFLSLAAALGQAHISLLSHFWILAIVAAWFWWVLGAVAAELYVRRDNLTPKGPSLDSWRRYIAMATIGLGIVWLASVRLLPSLVSDTLGSFVCTLLLFFLVTGEAEGIGVDRFRSVRNILAKAGIFSYSLYLTHVPWLAFICVTWMRFHSALPSFPALFLFGIASSIFVGWLNFLLVERHFIKPAKKRQA